jgi:hypothetical protein
MSVVGGALDALLRATAQGGARTGLDGGRGGASGGRVSELRRRWLGR